jgi:hypothetical protein
VSGGIGCIYYSGGDFECGGKLRLNPSVRIASAIGLMEVANLLVMSETLTNAVGWGVPC